MFDVLVIGGGHAGCEAAAAAARRGASTALLTFSRDNIGVMSCNPSIGGLGKGHIVREVDAFDGLMARAADAAAIHHRLLNRSKGTAVQGPRIQADRLLYADAIRQIVDGVAGLSIIEGEAVALSLTLGKLGGVILADGISVRARSVILATGTFLGGRMFRGDERLIGGRIAERPATRLAEQLRDLDLPMARLKTGTPPRLDGRTIDWGRLSEQPSDEASWSMSAIPPARRLPQIACAITRTTAAAHDAIRANLHRSPLYSGAIEAGGPRYCPSIEDKVERFGDRDGHQIFLEPEGLRDTTVYPNGLSTSLPTDVQELVLSSIPGMERTRIVQPGYAVEYDYLDPRSLDPSLALPRLPGLFCAGQINGTTGYEEAAGQGLVAGLNAAAFALDLDPVVLDRASSYLGVMIDDLTLQGVTEPYRMLTARAEYRLSLRSDNAETRLAPIAHALGCVSSHRAAHQLERRTQRAELIDRLSSSVSASEWIARGLSLSDQSKRSGFDWIRAHPAVADLVKEDLTDGFAADVIDEVFEDARYAPYIERQQRDIAAMRREEAIALPVGLSFERVPGLSREMIDRLSSARPTSLAAAARVRGITPAALSALLLHVRRLAA